MPTLANINGGSLAALPQYYGRQGGGGSGLAQGAAALGAGVRRSREGAAKAEKDKAAAEANEIGVFTVSLRDKPSNIQNQAYIERAQMYKDQGRDDLAQESLRMANWAINEPERFRAEAEQDIMLSGLTEETLGSIGMGGGEQGYSATTTNLPGNITKQTTNRGEIIYTAAGGRILEGQELSDALESGQRSDIARRKSLSDIDVEEVQRKERVKLKEKRTSDLVSEMSTRNRNAARDQRRISEALQLSSQASGGLSASAKLKLAKLLPNIDIADEAALDTTLTQLALDQLQSFKGPTTDFEYGVTESIVSQVSDPREAREAKLKALERAAWFNEREVDQYRRHIKNGGDSDNFRFNFGDTVSTKKGDYTLQDIQDTAVAKNISIQDVINKLNRPNRK